MVILISLILGIVLLYIWLIGSWFGRVLAFIAFAPVFGLTAYAFFASYNPEPLGCSFAALLAVIAAWYAAAAPTLYWREQARQLAEAEYSVYRHPNAVTLRR